MSAHHESGHADAVDAFFARCGLPASTRARCWDFVRTRFPNEEAQEAIAQGYCSYTFCVGTETVVQFRPPAHRLDIALANSAREVYGTLAPQTDYLGFLDGDSESSRNCSRDGFGAGRMEHSDDYNQLPLFHVYSLTRLPEFTLAEFRSSCERSPPSQAQVRSQRESLIRDFAAFIATGWQSSHRLGTPPRGRVGTSIRWRLEAMRARLSIRFIHATESVINDLPAIEALPWTLTHGDLVPSNVMVDTSIPGQLRLCGLLDWAEAEYLPFGIGLYGAEELLGHKGRDGEFRYFPEAGRLRELLWSELVARIPELDDPKMRRLVESAANLGMLLWHGIAFDNGKLDRVVEEGKDDEEIRRLDLFFSCRMTPNLSAKFDCDHNSRHLGLSSAIMGTWTYLTRLREPRIFLGKL